MLPTEKVSKTNKTIMTIDDRETSDVVVRLRTNEGRDQWCYCHAKILTTKSKYFADRLSDEWPTCQILDSRYCVEVYCNELEFNFYVTALRLFYIKEPQICHNVRNALGILQVAINLGCPQMANACMEYIEAMPWEEADEEEILKIIPSLGPYYERILARLQPVDKPIISDIFISAIQFATSWPPLSMQEMKSSAQEQIEYMLTEDDDAPLVSLDDTAVKNELRNCVHSLLTRFGCIVENQSGLQELVYILCDISWVCQILNKMEMMKDLVLYWVDMSVKVVNMDTDLSIKTKFKIVEVASKVLEAIGYGNVILPSAKRFHAVKIWLPYVQKTKSFVEQDKVEDEEVEAIRTNNEIWQGLESAFVSIILSLPLVNQADILSEWLTSKHVRYPDLSEAFEVWCYRSKIARRRAATIEGISKAENV